MLMSCPRHQPQESAPQLDFIFLASPFLGRTKARRGIVFAEALAGLTGTAGAAAVAEEVRGVVVAPAVVEEAKVLEMGSLAATGFSLAAY